MASPLPHALAEEIRSHYASHFGLPRSRLEVAPRDQGGVGLEVYEFTPSRSGLRLFVTVGLSLIPHERPVPELFFAVRRRGHDADAASLRRALMTFWMAAHRAPELFAVGRLLRTLGTLAPPVNRVVIAPALLLPEGAPKTRLSNGRTLWLGWLVPLHDWEAEYARRSGPVELLSMFQRSGIDPTIVDRPSRFRSPTGGSADDTDPDSCEIEELSRAPTVVAHPAARPTLVATPRGGLRADSDDTRKIPLGRTAGA